MSVSDQVLADRIAAYLKATQGREAAVVGLQRIHGGASRETYRVRIVEGGAERGFILRRDPTSALIETERTVEFAAYRAFHGTPVPVPEALALEQDESWLERPFFMMEEIENATAASVLLAEPYGPHAAKIGAQFFGSLGEIAKADPKALGLDWEAPAADACWSAELAKWEKVIDEDEREPQPIARAAIRWLRRNPPPPAQKVGVVHGDYRTGNFLFREDGTIAAILDWEMAHLGDPLEDLGWALDPLWAHHNPARPGGMCSRAEAIAHWERTSGLKADPAALKWWEMFASLKGLGIWISAAAEVQDGKNTDPVNAFSGWYCLSFHNQVIADRLAEDAA
ncbi:MAG: phosphotransferase family protein [Alphaproteobacteria bacterium]